MTTSTRLIEWVGAKSAFADPVFKARKTAGLVSPEEMRMTRSSTSKRVYRVDGQTSRILTPSDPEGLSKEYRWGPEVDNFVQRVNTTDWAIIQKCRSAKEFRDITDGIPEPSPLVLPDGLDLDIVKEEEFHSLQSLLKADWRL